jgi:hypothetical protein
MSGSNATNGVEIGLSGTNAGIELISSNATSTPFIDFTYIDTDYRGRIIYNLSSEQFSIDTATTNRMTIGSTKVGVLQTTASTSTTTGALTVAGGVGIAGNLYVGAASSFIGDIAVNSADGNLAGFISTTGQASVSNRIRIYGSRGSGGITFATNVSSTPTDRMAIARDGVVSILSDISSTSTTTGSLVVTGGIGASGSVNCTNLKVNASAGLANYLNTNVGGLSSTTNLNPGITVFESTGFAYGMDLGFSGATARTRVFYPDTAAFAVATHPGSTSPSAQSSFTERLTVSGAGVVNITATTASSNSTSGALTVAGGVGVAGNIYSGGIIGNSVSGTVSLNLANFLRPSLATTNNCNIAIGTAISTRNAAFLNFTNQGGAGSTDNWATMGVWGVTGELRVLGTGQVYATSTTASSSTTTGALRVDGGAGIAGQVNIGGGATITGGELDINHTSPILTIRNGTGAGKIYFGNSGHGVGRGANIGSLTNGNDVSLWTAGGDGNIGLATQSTQRLIVEAGGDVQVLNKLRAASLQADSSSSIASQGVHIQWNKSGGGGETKIINQVGVGGDDAIYMSRSTTGNSVTDWAKFSGAGLNVSTTSSINHGSGAFYNSVPGGVLGTQPSQNESVSIYATGCIVTAAKMIAVSDIRTKNIISTDIDISVIDNLTPTIYNHKDYITKGNTQRLGFIAQEVQEYLPNAVSIIKDYIPSIYQVCPIEHDTITILGHTLQVNDKIKLNRYDNSSVETDVLEITKDTVRIKDPQEGEEIFVYGKKVDDLLSLEHDHLMALSFAGVKELRKENRIMKHQIETLTQRILALEAKFI